MNGVWFDDMHSYRDFDLKLMSVTIPNPAPKLYYMDIPGSDGSADFTGIFGSVKFEQRSITLEFAFDKGAWYRYSSNSKVANALHGKLLKIILDDDTEYYYQGRVNFDEWKLDKSLGTLSFTILADPYKYEEYSSLDDWLWDSFDFENGYIREYKDMEVNGSLFIDIPGTRKETILTVISNAEMQVESNGHRYPVVKGRSKIYDISISEGENYLTFYGNGLISIEYRGGMF